MKIEVTSNNQSGGVTAGNIGGSLNQGAPQEKKKRWLLWSIIAGGVAFAAGVVKLLEYFGIKP